MEQFNSKALELFKAKGNANASTVRRVTNLAKAFSKKPFNELRILDIGCGEGVYSLEAGMNGAEVVAMDARDARLKYGKEVAEEHGLNKVTFRVDDVRNLSVENYGKFDVIYNLGLLYHLDTEEVFQNLEILAEMCNDVLIIDTTVGMSSPIETIYKGEKYYGVKYQEHEDDDSDEMVKDKRIMASIGNNESFLITKPSLVKFLDTLGFNFVFEVHLPARPHREESRITMVAVKGEMIDLKSYPWINDMSRKEVRESLHDKVVIPEAINHHKGFKFKVMNRIKKFVNKRGFELKPIIRG